MANSEGQPSLLVLLMVDPGQEIRQSLGRGSSHRDGCSGVESLVLMAVLGTACRACEQFHDESLLWLAACMPGGSSDIGLVLPAQADHWLWVAPSCLAWSGSS